MEAKVRVSKYRDVGRTSLMSLLRRIMPSFMPPRRGKRDAIPESASDDRFIPVCYLQARKAYGHPQHSFCESPH